MIAPQSVEHEEWVDEELYPGEKLLWVGNPAMRRMLWHNRAILKTALVLIASVFALILPPFWLDDLFPRGSGIHLSLWHLLFLLGVGGALGFLLYACWSAKRIVYAVTSRRALIIEKTLSEKIVLAYNVFRFIERRDLANGKGDLTFATETYTYRWRGKDRMGVYQVGFFGIDDAHKVEELLRNTFMRSFSPPDDWLA